MADTVCPRCSADIAPDDVNVKEGVAYCRPCDKLWPLRDLLSKDERKRARREIVKTDDDLEDDAADLAAADAMPSGCWLRDMGSETILGARCRSATGFFFLFFALFWNSITWTFVGIAVSGILSPAPTITTIPTTTPSTPSTTNAPSSASTPQPGVEASSPPDTTTAQSPSSPSTNPSPDPKPIFRKKNTFGGDSWFILLFMIPFVLVGIGTGTAAILGIFGRNEITLRPHGGTVFTGVGPIGYRRRFDPSRVRSVRITNSGSSTNGRPNKHIKLEADLDITFGVLLNPGRMRWLAGALRKILKP